MLIDSQLGFQATNEEAEGFDEGPGRSRDNDSGLLFIPHTNINSDEPGVSNVRTRIMKLFEEMIH